MRPWNVLLWLLLVGSISTLTLAAPPKRPQYKRIHQRALRKVLADDPSGAIADLGELDDTETDFLLTVANAQANQVDAAARALERALKRGLPPGRFIAGPRELLLPLRQRAPLLVLADGHTDRLIHGPMIGATTATTVLIWFYLKRHLPGLGILGPLFVSPLAALRAHEDASKADD